METYLPIRHPWVDSFSAPIYQVTFPANAADDKLLSYCHAVESWSTQVTYRVGWLMDLSQVESVSAHQRALFAKFMEGMEAFDRRCTRATAMILPNALLRGVATAIFWLYAPPFEHRTFAEASEGLAWLRELMGASEAEPGRMSVSVRPSSPELSRERASVRPNQS
jgi:hypothetical protein